MVPKENNKIIEEKNKTYFKDQLFKIDLLSLICILP